VVFTVCEQCDDVDLHGREPGGSDLSDPFAPFDPLLWLPDRPAEVPPEVVDLDADPPGDGVDRRAFLRHVATGALAVAAGGLAAGALAPDDADARPRHAKLKAPPIVSRAQWRADESIRGSVAGWAPVRKLIVHHTASSNRANDLAVVRFTYAYHVLGRGYSDVGYNFFIGRDGRIYEGRRARRYARGEIHSGEDGAKNGVIGGHALAHNAGSCGIALLGNFEHARPTRAAVISLIRLLAWEAQRHRIDPLGSDKYTGVTGVTQRFPNIVGHRGVGATACPGARLNVLLPAIRQQVATLVGRFPARTSDMRRQAWVM
jgi:hypothetical protein